MEKNLELDKLKKDYEKLKKKYNLPEFKVLNEDFEIERLIEKETETLLRDIRKCIAEKIVNYIRFLETMLNPTNAPIFILALIKNLSQAEKKKLDSIYMKLCEIEIDIILLDINYNEKLEANFITLATKQWQEIKEDIRNIIGDLRKDAKEELKKRKGYLG